MFVANDGFSAGHVVRTIAIAKALVRRAARRAIDTRLLLATTSEADPLLREPELVVVRLPAPATARGAKFSDDERRRLVRGVIEGALGSFGPDLLVVDTFPSGPHDELAGIATDAKRALVRRAVPAEKAREAALARGLDAFDLAIVAGDPGIVDVSLPVPALHVPPITISEARLARDEARTRLGLARDGRIALVASGGGGDADAAAHASTIARALEGAEPGLTVVRARGPLDRESDDALRIAPLAPYLSAFDVAFTSAGYNTSHELAKARVPTVLWAEPRPYDDQAARVDRFVKAGHAVLLADFTSGAIASALERARALRPAKMETGGADRAADALLDLATGGRR